MLPVLNPLAHPDRAYTSEELNILSGYSFRVRRVNGEFLCFCPEIPQFSASSENADKALLSVQQQVLSYLL